jgi:glucose-1-phosphate thymidylyltransferase
MKMKEMGIKSILIVSGKGHAGHFLELLGSGSEFGVNISYEVQEEAGGIAQALNLAAEFAGGDKFAVMLGDNVFEDNLNEALEAFKNSTNDAYIFLKEVKNPKSYGVVKFDGEKIVEIQEKPSEPASNFAVTGFYLYSPEVFNIIKTLKPSARGELEISDVNNYFVKNEKIGHTKLSGFWGDCGESFDSLIEVSKFIQQKS